MRVTKAGNILLLSVLVATGFSGCTEMKSAGRDIGHATRTVGHGVRDAVKSVGDGVKKIGE